VTGAATVVEGVAGGRKIALGIFDYLTGEKHSDAEVINVSRGHWQSLSKDNLVFLKEVSDEERIKLHMAPLEDRKNSFKEVAATFSKEEIMKEGERCIECSCTAKSDCKLKRHSEEYGAKPDAIKGEKALQGYDNRHPEIIHDRMKCIKCGICIKICSEVVNKNLLSLKNRGFYAKVEPAFGRVLPLECKECGACIEECPLGALDWKNKE
jgi:formate dehydrogenase major subunit